MDAVWQRRVRELLRAHPRGLTLEEVAENIGLSRAGTWPALDALAQAGEVREARRRGSGTQRNRWLSVWRLADRSPAHRSSAG